MVDASPALSPRQEAVLLRLAEGAGIREIAATMGTTERVVRRLRDQARERLGAATTTHAVAIVVTRRADARHAGTSGEG